MIVNEKTYMYVCTYKHISRKKIIDNCLLLPSAAYNYILHNITSIMIYTLSQVYFRIYAKS